MKKLKLNFKNTLQVLTREQLKHIVGGSGSGGSGEGRTCYCGGGTDPWSCPVHVAPGVTRTCTEICKDSDC